MNGRHPTEQSDDLLCVIILTFNERLHIERCLRSALAVSSAVVVVDSYSTDDTVNIARSYGATVFQHSFTDQASQFNWALENIEPRSQWILRLDADEYLGEDLQLNLRQYLADLPADVDGVTLNRRHIFMNRWIRHGTRFPLRILRIFRTGRGRSDHRLMDEHIEVLGKTVDLEGGFFDHNLAGINHFIAKHRDYANREARQQLRDAYDLVSTHTEAVGRDATRRRWLKAAVFQRLPRHLGPALYFFYRYFLRGGFLDGYPGFAYHFLQGWWYRELVAINLDELEDDIAAGANPRAIL